MMLHPQAKALLELIEKVGLPPTHTLPPEEARRYYRERRSYAQPAPPEMASVAALNADGISLRLYRPLCRRPDERLPVLVFFHGGGWVIGDLDTHDVLCRELATYAGCAVAAVDYRLAPEHRFPAAVEDAVAATRWVRAQADRLVLDASRIAVGGDSAGGNLATVVALTARDSDDPPLAFQLLIYPGTDMRCLADSHRTNGQGYLLTSDSIRYFMGHYLDSVQHTDWRASPLLREDLAGLPPALVVTAGYDPLRDEGLSYADRLTAAGNVVTQVCFDRQIHGFITMGRVIDEANAAVRLCAGELRKAFT